MTDGVLNVYLHVVDGAPQMQASLDRIEHLLGRVSRTVINEGVIMSEVDDRLAALQTSLGDLATDLDRELADLKNALAGSLTAEQVAAFDSAVAKVTAMKEAIDTADPAQPL